MLLAFSSSNSPMNIVYVFSAELFNRNCSMTKALKLRRTDDGHWALYDILSAATETKQGRSIAPKLFPHFPWLESLPQRRFGKVDSPAITGELVKELLCGSGTNHNYSERFISFWNKHKRKFLDDNCATSKNATKLKTRTKDDSSLHHESTTSEPSQTVTIWKQVEEKRTICPTSQHWRNLNEMAVIGCSLSTYAETDRLCSISCDQWSRDNLERWCCRDPKSDTSEPEMTKITHLHRFGEDDSNFEFYCSFKCADDSHDHKFWIRLLCIICVESYAKKLADSGWDIRQASFKYFEKDANGKRKRSQLEEPCFNDLTLSHYVVHHIDSDNMN